MSHSKIPSGGMLNQYLHVSILTTVKVAGALTLLGVLAIMLEEGATDRICRAIEKHPIGLKMIGKERRWTGKEDL